MTKDKAMKAIMAERGLAVRVAEACGIARAAVYQWRKVPIQRVHTVAPMIGMAPEKMRPDIFGPVGRRVEDLEDACRCGGADMRSNIETALAEALPALKLDKKQIAQILGTVRRGRL